MTIYIITYIHLNTLKGKTKQDFDPGLNRQKQDFETWFKHLKIGLLAMAQTPKKQDFEPWLKHPKKGL